MILPPEGFVQLKQVIDSNAIQRIVLDTVLPWISVRSQANMAEHVFSFVRAFDRLNTTTLMTMPKPVSPMAFRLKNALEEVVPVSVMLTLDHGGGKRHLQVAKYLGEKRLAPETEWALVPGSGLVQNEPDFRSAPAAPAKAPEAARTAMNARIKVIFFMEIPPSWNTERSANPFMPSLAPRVFLSRVVVILIRCP